MKRSFTLIIIAIALASISFAQTSSKALRSGGSGKTRIAVVEFTPGADASTMTAEAKRQLQASIAFSLADSGRFEVVDVRNTRYATKDILPALNGNGSTAAVVRAGKQLGVGYVLTGTVALYDTKLGEVTLKARLVEVATGKVKYSGRATGRTATPMRSGGTAEMMSKAVRPAIEDLRDQITGL